MSTNIIVNFVTKLSIPEAEEESKEEVAVQQGQKAECEPDMLIPLLVFLYNAMVNQRDLRGEFV